MTAAFSLRNSLLQKHHTPSSVRSLIWSYGSPSLVASDQDSRWQDDEWFSWRALELAGILDKPALGSELEAFLNDEKDHRLGARFERLIEFGLKHLPGFDCVERRLQVQMDGRTRGEFDFIVRNQALNQFEHWEVASKFYLGVPVDGSLAWVGPGKRDSLLRKLRHLTERQLLLAELPESQGIRDSLEQDVSRVRAVVKGRLFYPLQRGAAHDAEFCLDAPEGKIILNSRAPVGFWCDINQLIAESPKTVFALEKPQWLDPEAGDQAISLDGLTVDVEARPRCVDVVTRDDQRQRWFVVSPGWFDDLDPDAIS